MLNNCVSILDYGVLPDIQKVQTKGFQDAINACYEKGGGIVEVPSGEYVIAGIVLRSNITLHLRENVILKGSIDPKDYNYWRTTAYEREYPENEEYSYKKYYDAGILGFFEEKKSKEDALRFCDPEIHQFMRRFESGWNNGIIRAYNEKNISIIGEKNSCIDGQNCFDEKGEEFYRGPHAIDMHLCENVCLYGYTIKDSANWAHALFYCSNVSVKNITVKAGHDGVHMRKCRNVTIDNCDFYTGDDCVAGMGNLNVLVQKCKMNTACSAMRFGGTNAYITDCNIYGPAKYLFRGSLSIEEKRNRSINPMNTHRSNMLSAFTYYCDYSHDIEIPQGNIVITNCKMENVDRFIHYNFSGSEPWQNNKPLGNITFENIVATGISKPLTLYGDSEELLIAKFKHVNISLADNYAYDAFMHMANYREIILENVRIENCKCEFLMKRWGIGTAVDMQTVYCDVEETKRLVDATEEFYTQPI